MSIYICLYIYAFTYVVVVVEARTKATVPKSLKKLLKSLFFFLERFQESTTVLLKILILSTSFRTYYLKIRLWAPFGNTISESGVEVYTKAFH